MADVMDVLSEVWRLMNVELCIFVVTLAFSLLFQKLGASSQVRADKTSSACEDGVSNDCGEVRAAGADRGACGRPQDRPDRPDRLCQGSRRVHRGDQAACLVDDIVTSVRKNPSLRTVSRVLTIYHEELRGCFRVEGVNVKEAARMVKKSPLEMYTVLVHCAIRLGRHPYVELLFDDMVWQGVDRPLAFWESAMKQLAGQKQYHLALMAYDRLTADGLRPSSVTCSCLIGFAAEVGDHQRATHFYNQLLERGMPSIRGYMTMLRMHAKRQDLDASVAVLHDMDSGSIGMDSLALNVVLATGVSADRLKDVEDLLVRAESRQPPLSDVISYNTVLKGLAQRVDLDGSLRLLDRMKARGLKPNAISFNTVLDAAIRGGHLALGLQLLDMMRQAGLSPDKFSCSILGKGLGKRPTTTYMEAVLAVLKELDRRCEATPDLDTRRQTETANMKRQLYHSVLEAAVDSFTQTRRQGDAAVLLQAFSQMRLAGIEPSPVAQRALMKVLPGGSA